MIEIVTKPLGTQGLRVSALGLGCMGMSEFYGQTDDAQNIAVLHRALDLGVTFLDTADMYGVGKNEELLGRALSGGRREQAVVATKFGNVRTPDGGFAGVSGKPEYVKAACHASLQRLGMDVIDLYYQHRVDTDVPIEDTLGAMKALVDEGKVRFLGMSEAAPDTLRRAHAVHPISALQTEYSLWTRDPEENGVLETCRELGIGFVPYSPLGRGFLTGQIKSPDDFAPDDFRKHNPRFQGENFQKNLELVHALEAMAQEKHCTPGQLALAWVMAQGPDVVPIPGTKRIPYLEENVGSLAVFLTPADLEKIAGIAPVGATAGTRYPEAHMGRLHK